jgi:RNA polymerase sigma factor (sigma-70 family)
MTDASRTDEDALLSAARSGAYEFAAFYRHFEHPMLGFFVNATGRGDLAADLAAETFARALESVAAFDPTRGRADQWLFGIARNVLAESYRRRQVEASARARLGMPKLILDDHTAETIARLSSGREDASRALATLPNEQRQAIEACILHEREYPDIAQDLRCSEALVRQRVSRGLRTLRTRLAGGQRLPVILAVAVAITIALIAVVVLRHGRQAAHSTAASGPSGGSSRPEVIQTFGILRRRQTNADLDHELLGLYLTDIRPRGGTIPRDRFIPYSEAPSVLRRWGYPELDRALARVVNLPGWRAKALIAPTRFRPSSSSPHRSEGLNLALWIGTAPTIPPSSLTGTGPRPTSLRSALGRGLAVADMVRGTNVMDGVVLVPDGVASVKLGPFVSLPPAALPGVSTTALNAALAATQGTARVHDNIGALRLPIPVVPSRRTVANPPNARRVFELFGIRTEAHTTWFDTRGHVIKRTTTKIDIIVRVEMTRAR